jgi:hypothetical protein
VGDKIGKGTVLTNLQLFNLETSTSKVKGSRDLSSARNMTWAHMRPEAYMR